MATKFMDLVRSVRRDDRQYPQRYTMPVMLSAVTVERDADYNMAYGERYKIGAELYATAVVDAAAQSSSNVEIVPFTIRNLQHKLVHEVYGDVQDLIRELYVPFYQLRERAIRHGDYEAYAAVQQIEEVLQRLDDSITL